MNLAQPSPPHFDLDLKPTPALYLAVELLGPQGLEKGSTERAWLTEYLDAFKNTIAGGSSQIRRNIIGERLLGLPRGR